MIKKECLKCRKKYLVDEHAYHCPVCNSLLHDIERNYGCLIIAGIVMIIIIVVGVLIHKAIEEGRFSSVSKIASDVRR